MKKVKEVDMESFIEYGLDDPVVLLADDRGQNKVWAVRATILTPPGALPAFPPELPSALRAVARPRREQRQSTDAMTDLQSKFLESELGHTVVISNKSKEQVVAQLTEALKKSQVSKASIQFLARHLSEASVPKQLQRRAEAIVSAVMAMCACECIALRSMQS